MTTIYIAHGIAAFIDMDQLPQDSGGHDLYAEFIRGYVALIDSSGPRGKTMDLFYLGLMFAFVIVSAALVYGFEKLRKPS